MPRWWLMGASLLSVPALAGIASASFAVRIDLPASACSTISTAASVLVACNSNVFANIESPADLLMMRYKPMERLGREALLSDLAARIQDFPVRSPFTVAYMLRDDAQPDSMEIRVSF